MWQEIITYGIGIGVIFYLSIKIYRFFCNENNQTNHCDGCSGCILKQSNIRSKSQKNKYD